MRIDQNLPCRATKILARASGTLLPNAMNVNPITASGILKVKPTTVIIQTKTYVVTPIQMMDIANVTPKYRRIGLCRMSGMVT